MRTIPEGRTTLTPKPPTSVGLELAIDTSGFMRALGTATNDRAPRFNRGRVDLREAFELTQAAVEEIERMARETAATVGADVEEIKEILAKLATDSRPHYFNATAELRCRLNAFQRGEPLGPPINWRGLSAR